jgi:hypothetical protein
MGDILLHTVREEEGVLLSLNRDEDEPPAASDEDRGLIQPPMWSIGMLWGLERNETDPHKREEYRRARRRLYMIIGVGWVVAMVVLVVQISRYA